MPLDPTVTRYILSLGSRDSTTGWRDASFTTEEIEMFIFSRGAGSQDLPPGAHFIYNEVGCTADPVFEGDHIVTPDGRRFIVHAIEEHWKVNSFHHRDCHLVRTQLYQAPPTAVSEVQTRQADARKNTRAWINTYVRDEQITLNDDVTEATWACMYKDPPMYPLKLEFRNSTDPVFGLYVIGQPTSTALLDCDGTVSEYSELVPIRICTIDSTDVTGTVLQHKMKAELDYLCENYESGSHRSLDRATDYSRALGSMWLYDTEFLLSYRRDME